MKRKIEADVMDVLRKSNIEGNTLKLPQQLERKLYERTNKVLDDHGGKWNRSAQAHLFPGDAKELLGIALETGETENQQQAKQAFFTPPWLVESMIDRACLEKGSLVLEPSSGTGNIALAIYDAGHEVHCIEIDQGHHEHLNAICCNRNLSVERIYLRQDDFLTIFPGSTTGESFDAVIMNPPFTKGQDSRHILHAFGFLKPGGRLVAIASAGVKFRNSKNDAVLRKLIEQHGEIEDLPAGTFKEAGTNVNTVLIKIVAPQGASKR